MCTDGAACYPRACAELGVTHRSVSHARGEFNRREKLYSRGCVDIHTGMIDAVWKELKKYVPTSINNEPPVLNVYVKQFQWRFCHRHEKDLVVVAHA